MGNKKIFVYAFLVFGIAVGIISTVVLLRSTTDTDSDADVGDQPTFNFPSIAPSPTPISTDIPAEVNDCSAPAVPQNVRVEYPGCNENEECSFTQASCSWDAVTGASEYKLTVTEVETGTVVENKNVVGDTTKILFNITQNMTYKCDVSSVASCSAVSAAASDQLTCSTDGLLPTVSPTPTTAVVNTPTPTTPPVITTPTPTLPPTGPREALVIGGIMGAILIVVGGALFLL